MKTLLEPVQQSSRARQKETPAVDKEKVEVPPVPAVEFEEYVAQLSDELFKLQHDVCASVYTYIII